MPRLNNSTLADDVISSLNAQEQGADRDDSYSDSPEMGDLRDILGDTEPIQVQSVEAPGIGIREVRDPYSDKVWTIPVGQLADADLVSYRSPRDFKKDPNFYYECISLTELSSYMAQGFVPVTRAELGMPNAQRIGNAVPEDSYYVIDNSDVAIKIPRILGERRHAANKRYCDAPIKNIRANDMRDPQTGERISPDKSRGEVDVSSQFGLTETVGEDPRLNEQFFPSR